MNAIVMKVKGMLSDKETQFRGENLADRINRKINEIPELADIIAEVLAINVSPNKQVRVEITTKDFNKSKNSTSEFIIKR